MIRVPRFILTVVLFVFCLVSTTNTATTTRIPVTRTAPEKYSTHIQLSWNKTSRTKIGLIVSEFNNPNMRKDQETCILKSAGDDNEVEKYNTHPGSWCTHWNKISRQKSFLLDGSGPSTTSYIFPSNTDYPNPENIYLTGLEDLFYAVYVYDRTLLECRQKSTTPCSHNLVDSQPMVTIRENRGHSIRRAANQRDLQFLISDAMDPYQYGENASHWLIGCFYGGNPHGLAEHVHILNMLINIPNGNIAEFRTHADAMLHYRHGVYFDDCREHFRKMHNDGSFFKAPKDPKTKITLFQSSSALELDLHSSEFFTKVDRTCHLDHRGSAVRKEKTTPFVTPGKWCQGWVDSWRSKADSSGSKSSLIYSPDSDGPSIPKTHYLIEYEDYFYAIYVADNTPIFCKYWNHGIANHPKCKNTTSDKERFGFSNTSVTIEIKRETYGNIEVINMDMADALDPDGIRKNATYWIIGVLYGGGKRLSAARRQFYEINRLASPIGFDDPEQDDLTEYKHGIYFEEAINYLIQKDPPISRYAFKPRTSVVLSWNRGSHDLDLVAGEFANYTMNNESKSCQIYFKSSSVNDRTPGQVTKFTEPGEFCAQWEPAYKYDYQTSKKTLKLNRTIAHSHRNRPSSAKSTYFFALNNMLSHQEPEHFYVMEFENHFYAIIVHDYSLIWCLKKPKLWFCKQNSGSNLGNSNARVELTLRRPGHCSRHRRQKCFSERRYIFDVRAAKDPDSVRRNATHWLIGCISASHRPHSQSFVELNRLIQVQVNGKSMAEVEDIEQNLWFTVDVNYKDGVYFKPCRNFFEKEALGSRRIPIPLNSSTGEHGPTDYFGVYTYDGIGREPDEPLNYFPVYSYDGIARDNDKPQNYFPVYSYRGITRDHDKPLNYYPVQAYD